MVALLVASIAHLISKLVKYDYPKTFRKSKKTRGGTRKVNRMKQKSGRNVEIYLKKKTGFLKLN